MNNFNKCILREICRLYVIDVARQAFYAFIVYDHVRTGRRLIQLRGNICVQ
jgi:hypothetical protein